MISSLRSWLFLCTSCAKHPRRLAITRPNNRRLMTGVNPQEGAISGNNVMASILKPCFTVLAPSPDLVIVYRNGSNCYRPLTLAAIFDDRQWKHERTCMCCTRLSANLLSSSLGCVTLSRRNQFMKFCRTRSFSFQ